MTKKESVKIETMPGEEDGSTIFIMSLNIKGLDTYQRAKATKRFIDNDTKVLETVIETHLREFLRRNGVIPHDGSLDALNQAFAKLEVLGRKIEIVDRYYEIEGERIVGLSSNNMTVILEHDILSCAMEVITR